MKFYRVHVYVDNGVSAGFEFFTTKREAHKFVRTVDAPGSATDIKVLDIAPTKAGILDALKCFADHPDNG